jgi:hypothetical protein
MPILDKNLDLPIYVAQHDLHCHLNIRTEIVIVYLRAKLFTFLLEQ